MVSILIIYSRNHVATMKQEQNTIFKQNFKGTKQTLGD